MFCRCLDLPQASDREARPEEPELVVQMMYCSGTHVHLCFGYMDPAWVQDLSSGNPMVMRYICVFNFRVGVLGASNSVVGWEGTFLFAFAGLGSSLKRLGPMTVEHESSHLSQTLVGDQPINPRT